MSDDALPVNQLTVVDSETGYYYDDGRPMTWDDYENETTMAALAGKTYFVTNRRYSHRCSVSPWALWTPEMKEDFYRRHPEARTGPPDKGERDWRDGAIHHRRVSGGTQRTEPTRAGTHTGMRRLTKREWEAVAEALAFRLADEIEDTDRGREVYQSAYNKVQERL